MLDLEFYGQKTRTPLEYDAESNCAVVEQFSGWFVRPISDPTIVPLVRVGDQYLELERDGNMDAYVLPYGRGARKQLWQDVAASAGKLRLYSRIGQIEVRALEPALYVGPASLTESEFASLLDRLGQLALTYDSGVVAPVSVLAGQPGSSEHKSRKSAQNERLVAAGEAFLGLYDALATNWDLIRKTPAKEVRLVPQVLSTDNPHRMPSLRVAQRACQRPDLRRQEVHVPEEHTDTQENRFLAFVLRDVLIRQSGPLAGRLRQQAQWLRSSQKQKVVRFGPRYQNLWRERRAAAESEAKRMEEIALKVEGGARWAAARLGDAFLRPSLPGACVPLNPSARLTQSKEYGSIYRAFRQSASGIVGKPTSLSRSLVWALEERTILPTNKLYELWVILETHALLVDVFGFQPVSPGPLALVEVVNEEPELPEGSKFDLVFSPVNVDPSPEQFRLTLHYSPQVSTPKCAAGKPCFSPGICPQLLCYKEIMGTKNWSRLTPDVLIELSARDRLFRFALDAKYRRYGQQRVSEKDRLKYGVDSGFEMDLLITAKMKYLDALACDAVFVVHSDSGGMFTKLGNDRMDPPPHRERGQQQGYWPAHRFGALFASPMNLGNLERMLRCLLMYHAGLDDICWPCGNKLTEQNDGKNKGKQPDWKGDYYQCPDCGRFWISTICQGREHHRLIKMGRDSFHKTMLNKEWLCICPACGDEFQATQRLDEQGELGIER